MKNKTKTYWVLNFQSLTTVYVKGFGVFNSSKKRTKNFCPSIGQKSNFQVCFLEELKTPKYPFEID